MIFVTLFSKKVICDNENSQHKKWSFSVRISSVNVTKFELADAPLLVAKLLLLYRFWPQINHKYWRFCESLVLFPLVDKYSLGMVTTPNDVINMSMRKRENKEITINFVLNIWNVFYCQKTEGLIAQLGKHEILCEYIRSDMRGYFQVLDLNVNKRVKDFMRNSN